MNKKLKKIAVPAEQERQKIFDALWNVATCKTIKAVQKANCDTYEE